MGQSLMAHYGGLVSETTQKDIANDLPFARRPFLCLLRGKFWGGTFLLTHVLTHKRKSADGNNGAKELKKQISPSEKAYKFPNSIQFML